MPARTPKRYPVELRERGVRMVTEIRFEHESEWAAMGRVAELLGIGTPETVRKWCRQAQADAGARPGVTSEDSAELKWRIEIPSGRSVGGPRPRPIVFIDPAA